MSDYSTNVARGIAVLDAHKPGWRERISLELLDLEDVDECVLGQVFGSYTEGTEFFNISCAQTGHYYWLQSNLGFDIAREEYDSETSNASFFWELTHEWIKQIRATS